MMCDVWCFKSAPYRRVRLLGKYLTTTALISAPGWQIQSGDSQEWRESCLEVTLEVVYAGTNFPCKSYQNVCMWYFVRNIGTGGLGAPQFVENVHLLHLLRKCAKADFQHANCKKFKQLSFLARNSKHAFCSDRFWRNM